MKQVTRGMRVLIPMILGLAVLFGFQNCGDISITARGPSSVNSASTGNFCTETPEEIGLYTNIMFVVDMSGSNVSGNGGTGGTDPDKALRGNAIKNFLAKHRDNKYIHWGFVVFHNGNAQSYIPDQGGPTPNNFFTDDPTLMDAAITKFQGTGDTGSTPYKSALNIVNSSVVADQKKYPKNSANYELILLSDGYPTDYPSATGGIDTSAIYSDVENIVNIALGRVHLSTVYYGPVDATAENILSTMASVGNGKYQNTNENPDIDIDNLLTAGSTVEPYLIKQLAVYNMNAALCDDGTVGADSDADGLCDIDEESYNTKYAGNSLMNGKKFSATNRNSFDSRYIDSYYLKNLQGQTLPGCTDVTDEDNDLANACEEMFLTNANPQGPTVDWTNEMSTKSHYGDSLNFDSDGDGILDGLEMLFFKNKSTALNYNNIYEKINGLDYNYLFLNHLNPTNPSSSLPYNPQFTQLQKNDAGQNCYSYHQTNLPLYPVQAVTSTQTGGILDLTHSADENVILVYYIQVPEYAPNSKGILKYSYQKLKVGRDSADAIQLTPGLFEMYTAP